MSRPLVDQSARDAIRDSLDETLVVEAAAGTGKTTALVGRILSLLRTGSARLSSIVAVTFTEKAAAEMKLRLRSEIDAARMAAEPSRRARFDLALSELEVAHIGTIHSFCAQLLRERPVEARVDPRFVTADESGQEALFDEAFDRWFARVLSAPPPGVARVLRKRGRERDGGGPRTILRSAGLALIGQRDFDGAWERPPFAREAELDAAFAELQAVGAYYERAYDREAWLAQNLREIHRTCAEIARREEASAAARDYDGIEEELRRLSKERTWKYVGGGRQYGEGLAKQAVINARDAARAALEGVLARAEADLAACLHAELQELVADYAALKDASGSLDFLDLLVVARDLVAGDRAAREALQRKYTHILVDEFQDTDPLQAEILLLLAADDPSESDHARCHASPGKLFVVGDPKQSIYRFRRADVTLYERVKQRLVAGGARVVQLSTSFRSAPSLQRAVNAAFERQMRGSSDGSQAGYVALQPFRDEITTQPTLIALPVPRPYSVNSGKVTGYWIEQSIPDAVGAFVHWLTTASGWTIRDKLTGAATPVLARHVCLLFKRFVSAGEDVTRPYVRALEQRRVPHVLVGGRSLYQREEIIALKNALLAVEWPDDELSVFATLKGPFFALTDDALLAHRARQGSLHPMREANGSELTELTRPVFEALSLLGRLHTARNKRPIADTLSELLEQTRAHAGVAVWPTGEQALANLLRLLGDAVRFESAGATSFRGFVRKLERDEAVGGAAEAPVVEEGTDGVRIMTVHKAKGLEFPVVILVDPTCPASHREPSRYVDAERRVWARPLAGCAPIELSRAREAMQKHDEAEAVRLLYVAATRARDLLVVPGVGDERIEGWTSALSGALYPKPEDWRSARAAPGCPAFGDDSVLERPDKAERNRNASVRPGLHTPDVGDHDVVWWDPRALALDAGREAGLRHAKILSADDAGQRDVTASAEHAAWRSALEDARTRGAEPSHRVRTVTASTAGQPAPAAPVTVERTSDSRQGRPRGKAFGVLVHAVLASVPLDAGDDAVACVARAEGRVLGADDEAVACATRAAIAALAHPVLREAAKNEHRRESPVSFREEDGSLVVGTLDLAYRDDGGWVVVDFKTDAEVDLRRAHYEAQVRAYALAVSHATGEAARCVLLLV